MTFLSACYDFLQRALIFFNFTVQTFYSETEVWINFRFSLANFSFQSGWFFVSVRILFCSSLTFVKVKSGFCRLRVRILSTLMSPMMKTKPPRKGWLRYSKVHKRRSNLLAFLLRQASPKVAERLAKNRIPFVCYCLILLFGFFFIYIYLRRLQQVQAVVEHDKRRGGLLVVALHDLCHRVFLLSLLYNE